MGRSALSTKCGQNCVSTSQAWAPALPQDLRALYFGGGFPETYARELSANVGLMESLGEACVSGLPVYAECGGLMLLARSIRWIEVRYLMADAFAIECEPGRSTTIDRANVPAIQLR
jgi:cobyrinic acid a,c-diamide synthase